jgi:hypothetical protein
MGREGGGSITGLSYPDSSTGILLEFTVFIAENFGTPALKVWIVLDSTYY